MENYIVYTGNAIIDLTFMCSFTIEIFVKESSFTSNDNTNLVN